MSGQPPGESTNISRRVMLGMMGSGMVGIVFGSRAQDLLGALPGPFGGSGNRFYSFLVPGRPRFRIYSVSETFPDRSARDYRLNVTGLVARPQQLTLDDLHSFPATRLERDFQCVTGWRVRDVPWTGVRVAELLDRVGVRPEARAIRFWSFDGVYTESLTLEQARRPDVLVAYGMKGAPLSRAHGGPARLYVAPMYGYKSLKWLESIEVTDQVEPGYWERQDYDVDAWVGRSNTRPGDRPT
jgi:DMSO/TMAO reductase YedYZ molybdopterin-dependent catalytic subunit